MQHMQASRVGAAESEEVDASSAEQNGEARGLSGLRLERPSLQSVTTNWV
jgi:hypothetical protein